MAFTTESVATIVGQKSEPVESCWTSKERPILHGVCDVVIDRGVLTLR